jgi:hypothetical protein
MLAAPLGLVVPHMLDRMRDIGETNVIESEKGKTQTSVNEGESAGAIVGGDQITGAPGPFAKLL